MSASRRRVCALAGLALLLAAPVSGVFAQQAVHPTAAERARHDAHVQQLKDRKRTDQLRRRQQKQIQDTARKAYPRHPELQQRMKRGSDGRQQQSRQRERDLDRRIRHAERPQPVQSSPPPASSSS